MNTIEDNFAEMLNEVYGTFTVAGSTFDAADILSELDPIAYRCALADYEAECEDTEDED